MTFLNPLALLGLFAAAIPVIIHLINLQKPVEIKFSSIRFLKELQKSAIQKLKLKQLILLLVRVLIIIFLVIAFSQPTLKGTYSLFGEKPAAKLVIIFDDTYSMSQINSGGVLIKQAKLKALEIVDRLEEKDAVLLLKLSEIVEDEQNNFVFDKYFLREQINKITPSFGHSTIDGALKVASKLLSQHPNLLHEVYILTDNQATTVNSNNKDYYKIFDEKSSLYFISLNENDFRNYAVDTVNISNSIIQPNKPIILQAKIKNYGNQNTGNIVVHFSIDGKRVQQELVLVPANSDKNVEFTFTPETGGFYEAKIETENDQFDADDVYYFTINVPEKSIVNFYSNEKSSLPIVFGSSTFEGKKPFIFYKSNTTIFDSKILAQSDLLIITADSKSLVDQVQVIENYIEAGKGVVIIPSSKKENEVYFRNLISTFGISTQPIIELANKSFVKGYNLNHPIIKGMFESGNNILNNVELESPEFGLFYPINAKNILQSVVELSTGTPLVAEVLGNKGKLIIFTSPLEEPVSDITAKTLFVPLIIQTALYAATSTSNQVASLIAGEENFINFENNNVSDLRNLFIKNEKGSEFKITNVKREFNENINFNIGKEMAATPGVYSIENNKIPILKIGANINKLESNGKSAAKSEILEMLNNFGFAENKTSFAESGTQIASLISEERNGRELWQESLLAAVLLLFIETLIARTKKDNAKIN